MNRLTLFGLFAVTAMLVTYALENRSRWFILAFSVACVMGSVYGFLQGAWPFGLVWSGIAVAKWSEYAANAIPIEVFSSKSSKTAQSSNWHRAWLT